MIRRQIHVALTALLLAGPAAALADERPSVLMFVLDDATESIMTPRMTALASEGVRFSAVVPSPLCGPSRTSMLTGRHTHNHGITGNVGGAVPWAENAAGRTVADWFLAGGYTTARFGKGINGVLRSELTGWTHAVNPTLSVGDPGGVLDLTQKAVDLIEETPGPMFLYFAPNHDWNNPEPEYASTVQTVLAPRLPNFNEADVSDKRWWPKPLLTDDQIAEIDARHTNARATMETMVDSIGRLRAAFGSRPLIVVVVSDNGYEEGQHRFYSCKGRHFEESTRVPMFIIAPGVAPASSPALVYPLDLAPTMAEMAGVEVPELDGRSLVPLLSNPTAPWRERVLLEHGFVGVRTLRRKLVLRGADRELYNLTTDPYELRNRCAVGDTLCGASLEPYITLLRTCRGAACWAVETTPGTED